MIIDFIKKLLKPEQPRKEPEKETAKTDDILNWLDKKSKQISESLGSRIKEIRQKVNQEIETTRANIKNLASAELRNPNITLKEKQFMKGNREAYVKRANIFLDCISIPENYEELIQSYDNFNKELKSFGSSTARAYHILQDFFGNESREIALNLKNIDQYMKELNHELTKSGLNKTNKLKEEAEHLIALIKKKSEYESEIGKTEKETNELRDTITKKQSEIEEIKKSEEYNDIQRTKQQKAELEKQLEESRKKLWYSFVSLDRPLKKFERIAFENKDLVTEYVNDPVRALEKDKDLKVISIMEKLKVSIQNNKLDLKDKLKEKTILNIDKLNREFFEGFVKDYGELKNKLDETNKKIESSSAQEKLSQLDSDIEKLNTSISSKKRNLDYNKQELSKIDIDKTKKELVKEIKHALSIELTLT